ncbi:putative lysosomal acid lipase/cholesteryl ester hydrolase [Lacerta agilis]|uniref:putative lysosomal acid lipase/cholesteryl ester hydrolase n=1 Tax=Lacerta agilis TaxID=80427 RepID=UPI001419D52C|nr:putative lysosomal acid lipase/cholesteryl ester hydrolase [Lacerta agilis]
MFYHRFSRMWPLLIMMAVHGAVSSEDLNPEQFMNISQIIQYWGYPSEEYEVLTKDGYYLSLNRIPGGSKSSVLLLHGLTMEGSIWVTNLPHQSLGFILADAGYDVWIGNNRGNSWSRRHQNLSIEEEAFWDFSFHEMGIYDLPAMVDFILQKTGQKNIYYVGHSQGCTVAFVALSILPQMAEKIKMFFALAPAYTLQYTISIPLQIIRLPAALVKAIFGTKEFCLLSPKLRALLAQKCSCRLVDELCKQALFLASGFNEKNLNASRTDVYVSRFPDYTSVKNLIHWGQTAKAGQFRYFDYGSKNIDIYNQTTPPLYRIEEITIPTVMWSGGQDWVLQPKEIAELRPRITHLIHDTEFPKWNHWDFIWGLNAFQLMYPEILDLMEK